MTEQLAPSSEAQVVEAVQWALAAETPLDIEGAGTKRGWGHAVASNARLSVAGLSGITLYEPEELVLSAGAGTPLGEIEAALAEKGQMLAFEPSDLTGLWASAGSSEAGQTLGGAVACNLSGPRRIKSGAARDHFLGVSLVTGRGELVRSGGRVVKNVTGYDLCKLMAGSFGTLGVMTSLTVKVLPAPEKVRTVLILGQSTEAARTAMSDALNSPHDVSAAAYLPAAAAAASDVSYVREAGGAVTALRLEGPGPSVEHRCAMLRDQLSGFGATEELHGHNSAAFWRAVRDVSPLLGAGPADQVWRVSVAPTEGPAVAAALHAIQPEAHWFMDWGGGLLWIAGKAGLAGALRDAGLLKAGHATLMVAGAEDDTPRFQPEPAPVAALAERVRRAFDPQGILNPGRMHPAAGAPAA